MAGTSSSLDLPFHPDIGILDQRRRGLLCQVDQAATLQRGVFHSLVALQAAINRFLEEANQNPKPFRWNKDPRKIIAAVRGGQQALESLHSHDCWQGPFA
jgi:hypothetical protein